MAARIGLAVAAVVVLGWLAVIERDAQVKSHSYQQAAKGKTASAQSGLKSAGLLNPDTRPAVVRSSLYLLLNDRPKAESVIQGVLSQEPNNVVAWNQLLIINRGHNEATARRALAAIKRLDPLDAPSR